MSYAQMYDLTLIRRLVENSIQLTREQEVELFTKYWNGEITKEKLGDVLVKANIKFVVSIAKQFLKTTNLPLADLISEGLMGYCEAMIIYDDIEKRFSTIAVYWIKARISEHLEKHSFAYKIPHNKAQEIREAKKLEKAAKKLGKEFEFPPELKKLMQEMKSSFSIDTKIDDSEGQTFADIIECRKASMEMLSCEDDSLRDYVQERISQLSAIEQAVIRVCYKFYDEDITLKELANRTGLKYKQVSNIKENALSKLRMVVKRDHV